MEPQVVGKIVEITGEAFIEMNNESMPLEVDSEVYKGSTLVTGNDAHVEVRFVDDTMLSQGANSEVSIDSYVFEEPGTPSSILLNFTEGTLRTITGKIAEENPEGFEIKSPLATLGIRGTDIAGEISQDEVTFTLIKPGGPDHFVVIKNPELGDQRYLFEPGTFVTFKKNVTGRVETFENLEELLKAVPFTTLPNNGLTQRKADEQKSNQEDEDLVTEASDSEESLVQDLQDAIEADPNAIIDLPATGAGPNDQTSIDFKAVVATDTNWKLYTPVSTSFKNYVVSMFESDSELVPEFFDISPKEEGAPPQQEAKVLAEKAGSPALEMPDPAPSAFVMAPASVASVAQSPGPQIIFIGGSGDDVIIGNEADNIIFGGGGVDQQFGVGGDDSFVILGEFGPDFYMAVDEVGNPLSIGNSESNIPDGIIDGGPGTDTLIIYGDANFAPNDDLPNGVQIVNIEKVEVHSTVIFTPTQFESFHSIIGVDTPGENSGDHIVVIETEAGSNPIVDLSGKTIDNISKVVLQKGSDAHEAPTIIIDASTMDALNNTDDDARSCPPYSIEGVGRVTTPAGTDFTEFVTTYGDDIGPHIKLGNDPSAADDSVTTDEEAPAEFDVLSNDDGNDEGDVLSIKSFEQADHGTVSAGSLPGYLSYTPDAEFSGTDSFTYTIVDSGGRTSTATVEVTVHPVDDDPKICEISYIDRNGHKQTETVAGALTLLTLYGTLEINEDGSYKYSDFDFTEQATLADKANPNISLYAFNFGVGDEAYTDDSGRFVPGDGTATVTYQSEGVGVLDAASPNDDQPVPNQINHISCDISQALAVQFDHTINQATFTVSRLFKNEGPGDEQGKWEAFSEDGTLIDTGLINGSTATYTDHRTASFTIDTDADFQTVVFTATEYDGADERPDDSSDYFVRDVEWEAPGEQIEVTFKDVDDPDYKEVVSLTITEDNSTGVIAPLDPPAPETQSTTQTAAVAVHAFDAAPMAENEDTEPQLEEHAVAVQSVQQATPKIQVFGDPPTDEETSSESQQTLLVSDQKPFGDPVSATPSSESSPMEDFQPLLADTKSTTAMDVLTLTTEPGEETFPAAQLETDLPWIPPATDDGEAIS